MTNTLLKALFILLIMVLLFRHYLGWVKNSSKKIIPILTGVFALAISPIMVIFLTLFEVLFCLSVVVIVFLLRKPISSFIKKISIQKLGKLKVVGCILASGVVLWFGLAVFYRTDIGMPIGVQNYLFHKYHEEFDVNGFFGATIAGHPTNQLTCCPKDGNPATDAFNVVRKNTFSIGSRRFASDNYYGIIIREDYEEYISTFIDDYFDDFTVNVYFDFSGLSNTKYMSDEFDKETSLEEFLTFQKDDNNIRGCNFARIIIMLNSQPTIDKQELYKSKSLDLLEELSLRYSNIRIYIKSIEESSECITGMITHDSKVDSFRISDNFFKNEEEI